MSWKAKFFTIFVVLILAIGVLFFGYPRGLSLVLGYTKTCKVMRVEAFYKGMLVQGQAQKFSVICDDGSVCRAEDTGFAGVKEGDIIEFKGYPEFGTFEEFGKCDHAQLKKIIPPKAGS